MSRSKDLAKNTFILMIGNFCTKAAQFLLLPLYTGILSTSEYGSVELANTIISFLIPIVGLQLEMGVFRFLIDVRGNKEETGKIISTAFFFMISTVAICFLAFLLMSPTITYDFKWLVALNLIVNIVFGFLMQVARGLGNNKAYTVSSIVSVFITIGFNILFLVALHFRAEGLLYASAVGYLMGAVYLFLNLKIQKYLSPKLIDKKQLKLLLKYSVPVVFNSLSWWVFSSSDRVIVSEVLGLSSTGILSVAYKFSSIAIILYNVFYMSLAESVALHIKESDFEAFFNKVFAAISQIFISFGALLTAFMPIIFNVLINPEFIDAYGLIPIAILASTFQVFVGLYSTIYTAKNNTGSIAITSIMAAIVNVVVNLALINFIGVYAAVWSTLISYLALFVHRLIDINAKRYLKVKFTRSLVSNLIISGGIVTVLYYIDLPVVTIINIAIAVACAIYFNKDNANFLIGALRKKGLARIRRN